MQEATARTAWKPLICEPAADRIRQVVEAIAEDITGIEPIKGSDPGLPGGHAGFALFLGYLHAFSGDPLHEDAAFAHLERAIDLVRDRSLDPGLHGGYAGVAWVIEHLRGNLFDPGPEDPNEEIDRILLQTLEETGGEIPPKKEFDLISGLTGIGVYAVERLSHPTAEEILSRILAALERRAVRTPEGITWFTPPERLWPDIRDSFPEGVYNLGVSHGVPGVIGLLARLHSTGLFRNRVEPLMAEAVRWMTARRLPYRPGSCFPTYYWPGTDPDDSRLAWCYGDGGVAAVLVGAAIRTGDDRLLAEALAVAEHAARRPVTGSGVVDCALCHGSAGLAHLFNRLHQSTGSNVLRDAALTWLERTMQARLPDGGIGGYVSYTAGNDQECHWNDDPGFLDGAAGIGLALLAAISPSPPEWDRVLLLSMPRQEEG